MQKYAKELLGALRSVIDSPVCELDYNNTYELLVAVILSAQCTDKRVNMVTPELFAKYPTVQDLAMADLLEVERIIRPCGTFRIKAKNIINASKMIVNEMQGVVPQDMDKLTSLPGVGRKTASVVLAVGYNIPAMPVDTHILRVANRLGIVSSDDPKVVEDKLKEVFDKKDWIELHHLILLFGRYYCKAIGYRCEGCKLQHLCKYKAKNR